MTGYEWQEKTYDLWKGVGFCGVLNACCSAGKTHCACMCAEKYHEEFPGHRIWVVANSNNVLAQWRKEMNPHLQVDFYTYPSAVTKMHALVRNREQILLPNMMILDECHYVNARVWGQVVNFGVPHILGLSGTPSGSEAKIGPIFQTVDWCEANIAPTTIYMVSYMPEPEELALYDKKSKSIEKYCANHPYSNYKNDSILNRMYNMRRIAVYGFDSRLKPAIDIIKDNLGKVQMVFCMSKAQADKVSFLLDNEGIDHCVYYGGREKEIDRFLNDETNICISCKKLNTGFSKENVEIGVIVSSTTSPITTIQTASRMIRVDPNNPNKRAKIFYLLAEGTNDSSLKKGGLFKQFNTVNLRYRTEGEEHVYDRN